MERREIRFLVPPVYLLGALLWAWHSSLEEAAVFHQHRWRDSFAQLRATLGFDTGSQVVVLLATGGLVVLASGFLIGTASFVALRIGGLVLALRPRRSFPFLALIEAWNHEAVTSAKMRRRIWREHFGRRGNPKPHQGSLVVAAFDHQLLEPGMHAWIERRWNAFNLNVHSSMAVFIAMGVVVVGPLDPAAPWWACTAAVCALFVIAAVCAYRDTRRMNDLLAADDSLVVQARGRLERGPGSDDASPEQVQA